MIGKRSFKVAAGRKATVVVRLTKAGRRVTAGRSVKVRAIAVARDDASAKRTTARTLTLKRR